MDLLVNGCLGYMGREVTELCARGYRGATLAIGIDPDADGTSNIYPTVGDIPSLDGVDCIVDFSHHSAVGPLLDLATSAAIPTVIATTGHTRDELAVIHRASRTIPVFHSANMSLGVALLVELAETVALAMPDAEIEIVEKHHNRKLDAPSGTALMIADAIREARPYAYVRAGRCGLSRRTRGEIGIHSLRMGSAVGEHEVIISTGTQTLTLKHEAHSRTIFAEGAIAAAEFIIGCECGLYGMKNLISCERECVL